MTAPEPLSGLASVLDRAAAFLRALGPDVKQPLVKVMHGGTEVTFSFIANEYRWARIDVRVGDGLYWRAWLNGLALGDRNETWTVGEHVPPAIVDAIRRATNA